MLMGRPEPFQRIYGPLSVGAGLIGVAFTLATRSFGIGSARSAMPFSSRVAESQAATFRRLSRKIENRIKLLILRPSGPQANRVLRALFLIAPIVLQRRLKLLLLLHTRLHQRGCDLLQFLHQVSSCPWRQNQSAGRIEMPRNLPIRARFVDARYCEFNS